MHFMLLMWSSLGFILPGNPRILLLQDTRTVWEISLKIFPKTFFKFKVFPKLLRFEQNE